MENSWSSESKRFRLDFYLYLVSRLDPPPSSSFIRISQNAIHTSRSYVYPRWRKLTIATGPIHFPTSEQQVLEFWREIDAFKTSQKLSEGKPEFSFYDGPPFATGKPHYGHLLAGTIKVSSFSQDSWITADQPGYRNSSCPLYWSPRRTKIRMGYPWSTRRARD